MAKKDSSLPSIGLGPCVWMPDPTSSPSDKAPALVTRAGSVVSLIVFPTESQRGVVKEGVVHCSDPGYKYRPDHEAAGCWDFTDSDKALAAITKVALDLAGRAALVK